MKPPQKVIKMNTGNVLVPRTSQSDFPDEFMNSEFVNTLDEYGTVNPEMKKEVTGAMYYCVELLEKINVINKTRSTITSDLSKMMGQRMAKEVMNIIHSGEFFQETELLTIKEEWQSDTEIAPTSIKSEMEESLSLLKKSEDELGKSEDEPETSDDEPEEYEDEPEKDPVPFELKLKAVRLSELHPKWSLKTLATRSTRKLTSKVQLRRWKNHVKSGGTKFEKYKMIDAWVLDRFQEARKKEQLVTTQILRQWAMAAAAPLQSENFQFHASQTWCNSFKAKHGI